MPFEEVFARRLDIIGPTEKQLAAIGKLYVSTLVEDAAVAAMALQSLGIEVRIVSGGYRRRSYP